MSLERELWIGTDDVVRGQCLESIHKIICFLQTIIYFARFTQATGYFIEFTINVFVFYT